SPYQPAHRESEHDRRREDRGQAPRDPEQCEDGHRDRDERRARGPGEHHSRDARDPGVGGMREEGRARESEKREDSEPDEPDAAHRRRLQTLPSDVSSSSSPGAGSGRAPTTTTNSASSDPARTTRARGMSATPKRWRYSSRVGSRGSVTTVTEAPAGIR